MSKCEECGEREPTIAEQLKDLTDTQLEASVKKSRYELYSTIVQYGALFLLVVLCAGDPDLLDAIIRRVGNY